MLGGEGGGVLVQDWGKERQEKRGVSSIKKL